MLEFWKRPIACMFLFLVTVMMVMPFSCSQTIDEIFRDVLRPRGERNASELQESDQSNVLPVEYDMLVPKDLYAEMTRVSPEPSRRKKRKAIRDRTKRWPSAVVPYEISAAFTPNDIAEVQSAIRHWMSHTCLVFRPHQPGDQSWIYFMDGTGCSSYVGWQRDMDGQGIKLNKGCRTKKVIIHEIGHAIGFYHEHSRPDRDIYIRVLNEKLVKLSNRFLDTYGVPYDYKSIMHSSQFALSVNGSRTIVTVDPSMQGVIGHAQTLSFLDIKLANLMYNCSDHCIDAMRCPTEGFLGKDCNCLCPGNPISVCKSCGGNLSSSSGSFNSPNFPLAYNNNSNCKWAIKVPSGRIILTFTAFRIEPCEKGTVYDAVFVYDGATESARLLGPLCGTTRPLSILSSGNVMLVKFTSDKANTEIGFRATYRSTAVDEGQNWHPWSRCSVTCNGGRRWRSRACHPTNDNCREMQSCGQERCPIPVPSVWGIWIAWSSCTVTCDVGTQHRTRDCLGSTCPGFSRQTKRCQESPCSCASQTLTSLSGTFTSPNYPSSYPDDSNCRWTIQVVSGLIITLTFQDVRLEQCSASTGSRWDFLNVYDGPTDVSPRLAHLCGRKDPQPVTSTGNVMLVVFQSDGGKSLPGFNATYVTETDTGSIKLMDCDFETPCTQMRIIRDSDNFDWQRKVCCTPSGGTGPKSDHTLGNITGHFLYMEASDVSTGALSRMRNEPPLTHNYHHACVQFWYHMQGRHMGTLSVFYLEKGQHDKRIWAITGHQGHVWKQQHLTILTKPNQKFQVEFEAVIGSSYESDIAIDDIIISSGPCEDAHVLLRCDFETPCDYLMRAPNNDRFDWERQQCCTRSLNTGPTVDHTKGTKKGYFMYTEASGMDANNTAYLQTVPALRSTNTQACLTFWYHMKGSKMGSLEILLKNISIWRRSGNQGDQWHEAVVTFRTPVNQDFHVGFRATRGEDYEGDIAIDDVIIKSERCST